MEETPGWLFQVGIHLHQHLTDRQSPVINRFMHGTQAQACLEEKALTDQYIEPPACPAK